MQESLSPRHTVLLQANVTDAVCPCALNYRTTGKAIGTERDSAKPRDASSIKNRSRLSLQDPNLVAINVSPDQFRDRDIVKPRHYDSIIKGDRDVEPFDTHNNGNSSTNSDSARFFSHVVGLEAVSMEVTDVKASERMNYARNPVISESPKFVD